MKSIRLLIGLYFIANIFGNTYAQQVIFLHHSTGGNVFYEGGVENWINDYNTQNQKNYQIEARAYPDSPYSWENYPYDYWNLWINLSCDNTYSGIECLSGLCSNYDVIILKHCFPGAAILADDENPSVSSPIKTLANYKLQYRALRDSMDAHPDNKFIVWTLVPLHRLATDNQEAARAREFVDWVKDEWLFEDEGNHPNIYIFDFFGLVAELDDTPENGQVNCLKYEFEKDHEDSDSHPNTAANEYVGPIFAQRIVDVIQDQIVSSLSNINRSESSVTVFQKDNKLKIRILTGSYYKYLNILNLMGSQLMYQQIQQNENEIEVDVSNLSTGLYIIQLIGNNKTDAIKVYIR